MNITTANCIIKEENLISIIVPVYNVASYLKRCVDSIIRQTYKTIEIILIDDGSTDKSGEMCDTYEKIDTRVKVLHKENGGLSKARNAGLGIARGKYVVFIDSDDYVSKDYVEYLASLIIANDSQIAICSYIQGKDKGYEFPAMKKIYQKKVFRDEMIMKILYQRLGNTSAWGKIFLKELFDDILFPVGKLHEDVAVIYRLFAKADTIVFGNEKKYYYFQRKNSIVNTTFNSQKMDYLLFTKECIKFMRKNIPDMEKAAISRHFSACCQLLSDIPSMERFCIQYIEIKKNIEKYRKTVFFDKKARLINRGAALIAFISIELLYKILRKSSREKIEKNINYWNNRL